MFYWKNSLKALSSVSERSSVFDDSDLQHRTVLCVRGVVLCALLILSGRSSGRCLHAGVHCVQWLTRQV